MASRPATRRPPPAPQALWGELEPADVGQLPSNRDNTGDIRKDFRINHPFWQSVDIENGWVLAAIHKGLQVWDARTSPGAPTLTSLIDLQASVPVYLAPPEDKDPVYDVDAPAGVDTMAAVTMDSGVGTVILKLAKKNQPSVAYQDAGSGKNAFQVWAANQGGKNYAFAAYQGRGIRVYDMDKAVTYNRCRDDTPSSINCPGVFVGTVGSDSSVTYLSGAGHFLAASVKGGFQQPNHVKIYNVATPTNPQSMSSPVLSIDVRSAAGATLPVYGNALWTTPGGKIYLAVRASSESHIYDVSCLASGSCGTVRPIWRMSHYADVSEYATFSMSGSTPFVYFGNDTQCAGSLTSPVIQNEWLFDVSNPASPRDITPPPQYLPDPYTGQSELTGYWGWYYRRNPTGFNWVMPRVGKFYGEYFYRAANSIFDIHRRTGGIAPTADFTWSPTQVYPGTAVTFSDRSTGGPTSWSWSFAPDGTPATSTAQNPSNVTFATQGTKTLSLTTSNAAGSSDPQRKTLTVLDPAPAVTGVTASPASPLQCQPVTLTATGVKGQPTLSYTWSVTDSSQNPAQGFTPSNANPVVWSIPGGAAADTYTAEVMVDGPGGPTAMASTTIPVQALPTLPVDGSFAPTNDAFTAGTVQFHVIVAGATAWSWDFGDGNGFQPFTSDPISGPNPTHTYLATGAKTVQVKVRNCVDVGGRTSATLNVDITQTTPLVAKFDVGCFIPDGVNCYVNTGASLTFTDQSVGPPDQWDYDWNGTGTFDGGNPSPVTSHAYLTTGTFQPRLKVHRGSETDTYQLPFIIHVTSGTPPPPPSTPKISISGSTSGQVDQALSFTASATNCTPSATWSWSATGGGSVSGTTKNVTIAWPSAGTKSVTVTNSGCSGAAGSKTVSITDGTTPPPSGGGAVGAAFSYTPTSVASGQQVAFDASASTGSPSSYSWDFGDGDSASGVQVSHTFAKAGSFKVKLTVGKAGSGTGCEFGVCSDSVTKTVTVTGEEALAAAFDVDASCLPTGGTEVCTADTGQTLTFTDKSTGKVTSRAWDFGDGATAQGASAKHTYNQAGTFVATLTVQSATASSSATKTFKVSGAPAASTSTVVLPWLAQADQDKALPQTSDLYLNNPGSQPMTVTLVFRNQGLPEPDPPQVQRTVAPNATLYLPDVIADFNRSNVKGFLYIEPAEGSGTPVVTSFNRTFKSDGSTFGQVVPGLPLDAQASTQSSGTPQVFHLVGLNDTDDRLAYFGINNPTDQPLSYNLRFFDALGHQIYATSEPEGVAPFGQKVYQVETIRSSFNVQNQGDYRVEIEPTEGSPRPVAFGANLRLPARDPSFLRPGRTDSSDVYLVGALDTPGLNGSVFQTDLVLSNPGTGVDTCDITYTPTGATSETTAPIHRTLQPGETQRLSNVVAQWDIPPSVGVLAVHCDSTTGVYPVVQGESYDVSSPSQTYGQFMPALTSASAAEPGKSLTLTGLRQNDTFRTTLWLYNPGDGVATYTVHYFDLQGNELGGSQASSLGAGKFRQINPGAHPLPAAGIDGGFTVRVEVTKGKLLVAGQVVNDFNDPAYIVGR